MMNRRGFFGSVAAFFSFLFGGKKEGAVRFKRTSVTFNGKVPEVKEVKWENYQYEYTSIGKEEFLKTAARVAKFTKFYPPLDGV